MKKGTYLFCTTCERSVWVCDPEASGGCTHGGTQASEKVKVMERRSKKPPILRGALSV